MKIVTINGITKSGKTTTVEAIIRELKRRKYSVGSIKDIHFENFAMDEEGTNTHRHHQAGADMVIAKGIYETDVLIYKALDIERIFDFFDHDWLVCEGVEHANIPKIVTGRSEADIELKIDDITIAISGVYGNDFKEYSTIRVFHFEKDITSLVDYLEKVVPHRLPNMEPKCCMACDMTCHEMLLHMINNPDDNRCVLQNQDVTLTINGVEVTMVPFVQKLLKNAVVGVVSELEGYKENSEIKVEFKI